MTKKIFVIFTKYLPLPAKKRIMHEKIHPPHLIRKNGFTLIEISIVLVIIGLVIGGVLFGKDLIKAAQIRSLISQVDQYKLLTNTFKEKYGQLPGDMHPNKAAQFGFFEFTNGPTVPTTFSGVTTVGNNNGKIESEGPEFFCTFECGAFWRHLSDAGLIAGNYGQTLIADRNVTMAGTPTGEYYSGPAFTSSKYMPAAQGFFGFFGAGNLSYSDMGSISGINENQNLFWVVPPSRVARQSAAEPNLSAMDMYSIDSKIDDGKPNVGKFIAQTVDVFAGGYSYWSATVNTSSDVCTTGGSSALDANVVYNLNPTTGGNKVSCNPMFLW